VLCLVRAGARAADAKAAVAGLPGVHVLAGNVAAPDFELAAPVLADVSARVTTIIHCAGNCPPSPPARTLNAMRA
jgi:hypothetical protein